MGVKLYKEPELENVVMFCGWPGIGNVGLVAIDTLRVALKAEEFGEIEPFEFFAPQNVVIRDGLLEQMVFPSSKFFYKRLKGKDLIFFIGQQQPAEGMVGYAQGHKAYKMAELVLDVAEQFHSRGMYTSGAAVSMIHHSAKPRVWAVPNKAHIISELKAYDNTVLMSEIEGRDGHGAITGLNGLLLGVAKKRAIEAACLMGEVPYYLQGAPWPYPKASRSVVEVLAKMLDIEVDMSQLDILAGRVDDSIEQFLQSLSSTEGLPAQARAEIEKLLHAKQADLGPITDAEKKEILDHIDELFKGEDRDEKRRHI
ncbi:MAG: PAC2 family protein [Sedimentisphaerales bacterium]|nr:PAC2 family protein [Sedimentisphaerales bacterium]